MTRDLLMQVDLHEPDELKRMLAQTVFVEQGPYNADGYADYIWTGYAGQEQTERKTWDNLLSGTDAIEEQLRRQLQAHPEVNLNLLIEGVATPTVIGTATWAAPKGGKAVGRVLYKKREIRQPIQKVYSWLRKVSRFCEVWFTSDMNATARLLVAFARSDKEADHSILNRHLKLTTFHANPQVVKMMGVADGVAASRAEGLIARFGTVWRVLNASPEELTQVDGIGPIMALSILRGAGRPDV